MRDKEHQVSVWNSVKMLPLQKKFKVLREGVPKAKLLVH